MTGGPTAPPAMSNLQQRAISAVVLAVLVLGLTWLGGLPFRVLSAAIAALVFYEWCAMARDSANRLGQMTAAVLLALVLVALVVQLPVVVVLAALAGAAILSGLLDREGEKAGWTAPGLLYAGLSGISLALLRGADHAGLVAVLFLFSVVWATDILAYFVGRAVGGPKLAPSISPGKTWSGAIGGTVGGTLAGLTVAVWTGQAQPLVLALAAVLLSVVSQVGDLFESWVKRRHGVKDSSHLIPGHGGVMDRVDGLVAAAVALYVIGLLAGSADNPAQALFAN